MIPLLTAAILTWYNLVGQHHAAYWHGFRGAPPVVTTNYPGVAACTDYAFGTVLRFQRGDRIAYGVVIDRRARYTSEYCEYFDAWPYLAQQLGFGPSYGHLDKGVVRVRVSIHMPYERGQHARLDGQDLP